VKGGNVDTIKWNELGQNFFEIGVDRGVLFVEGHDGVPWNGLISVSETPTGGEVTPYYIDGIKYLNYVALEEFAATIEAYTYPEEFGECDGTQHVMNGLFATQQRKKSFGLAYRTLIGNDVAGTNHAYKIHLVYNATAETSEKSVTTLSDSPDASTFSWDIVTKPPTFVGSKGTAHFVIDSRHAPSNLLSNLEDILYGSYKGPPRLPSASELLFLFSAYSEEFYDAGYLVEEYFALIDAGVIPEPYTETIDPGGP
jgi:hypothetical protein